MQITVTTEGEGVFSLEVSHELTLRDLKALVEIETGGINPDNMLLIHNMAPMGDLNRSLGDYDVKEGDIIMIVQHTGDVNVRNPAPLSQPSASSQPQAQSLPDVDWSAVRVPGSNTGTGATAPQASQHPIPDDPDTIRQHLLSDSYQLSILRQRNPALAEALTNDDPQVFREAFQRHTQAVRDMEMERIRMINADPFDPENQQRIARTIQQRNIEENMNAAIEYTPESFSRVNMLYVHIKVNGVPVKALVDSGAGSTIMSEKCAERCNIMRLVDQRFAGVAYGIGRQTIIGKVHLGQLQIEKDFLTSSFLVLKDQAQDMLLGLDMLRRHQCCIDLKDDVLKIGTTGNNAPFLKESELKEMEEMEKKQALASMEDEDAEMAKVIAQSEQGVPGGHSSFTPQSQSTNPPSPSQSRRTTSHVASSAGPAGGQQFPEESIQRLVSAGFSRSAAIEELQRSNGNAELALISLLAKSIQF